MNVLRSPSMCKIYQLLSRTYCCIAPRLAGIPLSEYADRRSRFAHLIAQDNKHRDFSCCKHNVVILPAAELQYMSIHVPYPFHQDSYFHYLTGFQEANSVLMMHVDTDRPDNFSEHLFVETRSAHSALWDGPTLGPSAASQATGIKETHSIQDFVTTLINCLSKLNNDFCFWYSPISPDFNDSEKRPLNKSVYRSLLCLRDEFRHAYNHVASPERLIDRLRLIKSTNELRLLQQAVNVTSDALIATMRHSHPEVNESDLWNRIEFEARSRDARLAYPPVTAGGSRANIIHYLNNCCRVNRDELVLMDAGCRVDGYTADLTRTWPVSHQYTPAQRVLHDLLCQVQQRCASLASPESNLSELHSSMLACMHKLLIDEKLIASDSTLEVVQRLCPHYVGHFLGLDVHDTPSIPMNHPLEPGTVFPLEPGLYMRPELARVCGIPADFVGLGLRVEDDFCITPSGSVERLSSNLPQSSRDIETMLTAS